MMLIIVCMCCEPGVVVNIYCVSNVTELVKDRSITQLDMPVGEILRVQAAEVG